MRESVPLSLPRALLADVVFRIGTLVVITRVTELFKGDPDLAEGFNLFLPPGYRIVIGSNGSLSAITPSGVAGSTSSKPLPPRKEDIKSTWKESPHVPKINPELKTALDYFELVRETYVEEPEVCAAFQKLIADAGAGRVSVVSLLLAFFCGFTDGFL